MGRSFPALRSERDAQLGSVAISILLGSLDGVLAAQKLSHEKPGQTLQATALVHEAYIRLVDDEKARHWNSRGHFFAAAAEARCGGFWSRPCAGSSELSMVAVSSDWISRRPTW
jgi:hypothetical protein